MSESTERLSEAAGRTRRGTRATVLLAWGLLALLMMAVGLDGDGRFRFVDSDHLMRLVQVRDLISGQGWFDLTQYRLGPDGVVMHWSRLVDAPIAGLILLLSLALEPAAAERAAMIAWPLLLGLPFLLAVAAACRAMGGRFAVWFGLILALGLGLQSLKFAPGALDHHNVQMVLVAAALAGLLARRRGTAPLAGAGLASAASLAVGVETAPQIAALSAAVGLLWAAEGPAAGRRTAAYAVAFGGGLLAFFVLATPPENRFWPVCDVLTLALLVPALVGAAGLGAASLALGSAAPRHRALVLAGVAAGTAIAARAFPNHCLRNPLDGLDPQLQAHWMDLIAESRSGFEVLSSGWDQYLGVYVVPLIALAFALQMAIRGHGAGSALALALLIAVSYAATLYQIRGMYMLGLVSIPPLAVGLGLLYARYRATGSAGSGLAVVTLLALGLPPAWAVVPVIRASLASAQAERSVAPVSTGEPKAQPAAATPTTNCHEPELYAALASLPPGRVSASSNLGAPILRATPHSVLAAPYHRNQAGMLAQLDIAAAPAARAEADLRRYRVDYVATCAADREYDWLQATQPDSLFARLARGQPPDYLERVSVPNAAIRVYRLRGEDAAQ